MQPLPPTVEAFEKLDRVGLPDAAAVLQRLGRRALAEVPECVGLSLTLVEDGITLTLVSSSLDVAQIDAMQYLDGGPCVAPVGDARTVQTHDLGLLDEDRWSLFSRSSAAAGVQSTLSLSISDGRSVVGGINLYAGVPNAFEGHVDALASAFHADALSAVKDADLAFSTRRAAAAAPQILAARADVQVAVGMIAAQHGVDFDGAESQLLEAAAQAGIPIQHVARAVIAAHTQSRYT